MCQLVGRRKETFKHLRDIRMKPRPKFDLASFLHTHTKAHDVHIVVG